MGWSLRVATVFGIPIKLHITFLLLLPLVAVGALEGLHIPAGLRGLAFIGVLFGSVLLHELGHAVAALCYRVHVRDIVLLPIGGVAAIHASPRKTVQEFVIAVAGPLVSFALAIAGATAMTAGDLWSRAAVETPPNLLTIFTFVNVGLGLFNMTPAFPMDGGRIMRALLAMVLPYQTATYVAASIGRLAASAGLILGAVFGHVPLMLVSVFIFLAAGGELRQTTALHQLESIPARSAMQSSFVTAGAHWTLGQLAALLHRVPQDDFPVVDGDNRLVGMLDRWRLQRALQELAPTTTLGEIMAAPVVVSANTPLAEVASMMFEQRLPLLAVVENDRLVGLLSPDQLQRFFRRQQVVTQCAIIS